MKKFNFKQGFDVTEDEKASIVMELSIVTENMQSKVAYRLMNALDKEYKQILREFCGVEEGGFKEWQMCHLN